MTLSYFSKWSFDDLLLFDFNLGVAVHSAKDVVLPQKNLQASQLGQRFI